MPVDITLAKAKYRPKNFRVLTDGTKVFQSGGFGSKSSNSGVANKVKTLRPRRRAYGPW